ncbi:right-handed parallel beta-helix repeat-containing protein [Polyangium sp. 15x6]|uniref:right-handed parallel beta-helix repeat-containing protein n=1 Tax=Polyangium sp. 15x6 TaxID=3042687 RepID=UPI00249A8F31|nr:right-handed parallel beta-helix repeat-containing protein [Polyangium sp. 15x6]MDI3283432.1 right-handed parallel beta-helix repeat-containing protein [Polyangium sp. 15x6]
MLSMMRPLSRCLVLALLLVLLASEGCSSEPEAAPAASPKTCPAGELLLEDGQCQPAGLPPDMVCPPGEWEMAGGGCAPAGLPPDMACPPGEMEKAGGGCQAAGIPQELCATGFSPDGHQGCAPILPMDPCPDGMMAVPGDMVCREVAPCGTGDWGNIPVDATTEFVNAAYPLNDSDGSQAKPWKTIKAGLNAAATGAIVAIAAGTYAENLTIEGKPVKLWGRCPSMVEIAGTSNGLTAILVRGAAASASEVRGISITGPKYGIAIGSVDVVLDRVRVHDTGDLGIAAVNSVASSAVIALTNSLVERATSAGVVALGATVTIERSVVRETKSDAGGAAGRGILAQPDDTTRSHLTVRDSSVERNHETGIFVLASDVLVEATVVTGTLPDGNGQSGRGIEIGRTTVGRSHATVRGSFLEKNHQFGIFVAASDAVIESTVVRGTPLDGSGQSGGGIWAQGSGPDVRSDVTVRASLIDDNREGGILLMGSDGLIETTVVRETKPIDVGTYSAGIKLVSQPDTGARSNVIVRGSRLEKNHIHGLHVLDSDASVEATVVQGTQLDGDGKLGWGMIVATSSHDIPRAKVAVSDCLIENNHEIGMYVGASDVTVEATVIRATQPGANGVNGIGLVAETLLGPAQRANVTLTHSIVEKSHGFGVLVKDSDMEIDGTAVRETMPDGAVESGRGIEVVSWETGAPATLTVRQSSIHDNHSIGISVVGAEALIEATLVRKTMSDGTEGPGRGINIQSVPFTAGAGNAGQRSNATVYACTIEQNSDVGIYVGSSDVLIEATVVRENQSTAGIMVENAPTGEHANVIVRAALIEKNKRLGIGMLGADVRIEASVVRDSQLREDGDLGRGIQVQLDEATGERANAEVYACLIEDNHESGIFVVNSDATIESTLVRGTTPNQYEQGGDGITAASDPAFVSTWGALPPSVAIAETRVENNTRAGIANFGSTIQVVSSQLVCHKFDLNGENEAGYDWSFEGSHDNLCGCPEPTGQCGAKSAGLEALPPAIDTP